MDMTDLRTLVEPLKREVAVPGAYAAAFPSTTDDDLAATLADSFAEAQLSGFFGDVNLAVDATASPTSYETTKDLSTAGGALLVLFAGLRISRNQLRSLSQSATYKAGPVEYSTAAMTSVVKDEIAAMRTRLDTLILQSMRATYYGRNVSVLDTYATKLAIGKLSAYGGSFGSFYDYEFYGPTTYSFPA